MANGDTTRYVDFDALLARHRGLIHSLCWWHADGDADRMADLMQEVLMHLWHARHTLRPGATAGEERQWVRVRCRSVFEHLRRRPRVPTAPLEEARQVAVEAPGSAELIDHLAAGLNDVEHRVLELLLDGYTDGEIGAVLHLGADEAKRLRLRVIEKMKERAKTSDR